MQDVALSFSHSRGLANHSKTADPQISKGLAGPISSGFISEPWLYHRRLCLWGVLNAITSPETM